MNSIITKRVIFVTSIMGLFGGVLHSIVVIIRDDYFNSISAPSLSMVLAFLATLLISLLIKGRWNAKIKMRVNIAAALLFVFTLVSIFLYMDNFLSNTLYYEYDKVYYIKGELTDMALKYKEKFKNSSQSTSDKYILHEKFGGKIAEYFTDESVNKVRLHILTYYTIFILCFSSTAYLISEVLITHYKKTEDKIT